MSEFGLIKSRQKDLVMNYSPPTNQYFVTCPQGVEPLLHQELKDLRMGKVERQVGGVQFVGSELDSWRANLWLRTGIRVLMQVGKFHAKNSLTIFIEGFVRWIGRPI